MITGKELAEKLYSEIEEDNLFQEIYEKAFSEGYEYAQKEFARRDYEGLLGKEQELLKSKRSEIAKNLLKKRAEANSDYVRRINSPEAKNIWIENNPGVPWEVGKKKLLNYRNNIHDVYSTLARTTANEARESIINNRGVLDKARVWASKNPKMALGGTLLATAGTIGTGIAMSGNKKEDKK